MSKVTFGDYIRKRREEKEYPLRKLAAHLDNDTSTLSKVERGKRPATPDYLKPLAVILELGLKEFHTAFITDKINKDFGCMEHLTEGLKEAEKQLKRRKK